MDDIFGQIAGKIFKEQELIIGPLAWDEIKKMHGLKVVNPATSEIALEGDEKEIIDGLCALRPALRQGIARSIPRSRGRTLG